MVQNDLREHNKRDNIRHSHASTNIKLLYLESEQNAREADAALVQMRLSFKSEPHEWA